MHSIWNVDAGESCLTECIVANCSQSAVNSDLCQCRAIVECRIVNHGDTTGNSYPCQAGTLAEGRRADGGDGIDGAFMGNRRRDAHETAVGVKVEVLIGDLGSVGAGDAVIDTV